MTDQRAVERVIAQLRAQVTELARLQSQGGTPRELEQRSRTIDGLKNQLADAVREQLQTNPPPSHRTRHAAHAPRHGRTQTRPTARH